MKPLKIGISGVRGVVGETFTPDLVVGFAQAFGTYLGPGRILVCRDTRPSGPMVSAAVMAGLLATGCDVVDLGICPTPSLQLAVRWLKARRRHRDHGRPQPDAVERAQVRPRRRPLPDARPGRGTARHLPPGRVREGDLGPDADAGSSPGRRSSTTSTCCRPVSTSAAARSRRLKVAVDCCNGSCSLLAPRWLTTLGCEVLAINDDPSAPFPHSPEPKPDTAVQVRALVKAGPRGHRPGARRRRRAARPGGRSGHGALRGGHAGARDRHRAAPPARRRSSPTSRPRWPSTASRRGYGAHGRPDAGGAGAHLRGDPGARRGDRRRRQRRRGRAARSRPSHDSAAAIGCCSCHLAETGAPLSALVARAPAADHGQGARGDRAERDLLGAAGVPRRGAGRTGRRRGPVRRREGRLCRTAGCTCGRRTPSR